MDKYAIVAYVKETELSQYSNQATAGVGLAARNLILELSPIFGNNLIDLGPSTKIDNIITKLQYAAQNLDANGLCLFYFHGHGDSVNGIGRNDEATDEALVCNDGYLFDDSIDEILQTFQPTQRILSIVDSCSSESVFEWSMAPESSYPQIIHIASAADGTEAGALPMGGIFSRRIWSILYGGAAQSFTYQRFTQRLQLLTVSTPCVVRKSPNVSDAFLNSRLFT